VWRDILCEGPCHEEFASTSFWDTRTRFMSALFELDESVFYQKSIMEWENINSKEWDEIVLWFEYDLFCQINMMGILSYLFHHFKQRVSLICMGNEKGYTRLVGLGEIPSERYLSLFESRKILKKADLEYADKFWACYCKEDPSGLQKYIKPKSSTFPYLREAVKMHFQRFGDCITGVGIIEMAIIKYIKGGINSNHSIVSNLINEDWEFGFGDLQYFIIMERMREFYHFENGLLEISDLGLEVCMGRIKYDGSYFENEILGGLEMSKFEYDSENQMLVSK